MEPSGEQPNRPPEGRPPLPRHRPLNGPVPPIQRRPPLSRNTQQPVSLSRPSFDKPPAQPEPQPTPEPIPAEPIAQPANLPPAEPVIQMPASHIPPPPVLPEEPAPVEPEPTPEPPQQPTPLSFTPPPKKKRSRLLTAAVMLVGVAIIGFGIFSFAKAQAAKNNPDTAFKDALQKNLSLTTLQSDTKTDTANIQTKYDFTNTKNPIVSTKTSLDLEKGTIGIDGYGSLKDTFVSYTELPSNLGKSLVAHTKDGWIKVRVDNVPPRTPNATIDSLIDPRYQAFGPIITGNFNEKTRKQLIDFMLAHKVYGYDVSKVTREMVGDQKMIVYPVKIDPSYLKITSQSAAVNEVLDPTEIQAATDAMESLRGAKVTIYINAKDHSFSQIRIVKDGKTKTISYTDYAKAIVPDAPQTKLSWLSFAPIQAQIDTQTSLTKATY